MSILKVPKAEWSLPLLEKSRYKFVKGGRGSGKSHERMEAAVLRMAFEPDLRVVCIREIHKSLKFSSKSLIEAKIKSLGLQSFFNVTQSEIRHKQGDGLCIFQGMQDHTADSIKSLEDFSLAIVEEAQSLSARSLRLLRPTIRSQNSEIWFIWNPESPDDPVDDFARKMQEEGNSITVHVNYDENPFLPDTMYEEMLIDRKILDPMEFAHIWLGAYWEKSDSQILGGKWRIEDFTPHYNLWDGPYYGIDWGFSVDPTAMIKCWIYDNNLYIEKEAGGRGIDTPKLPEHVIDRVIDDKHDRIRADNARPETISQIKNMGYSIMAAEKWKGSVEDGIAYLRSFNHIIIHPSCKKVADEAKLYCYQIDKNTGDVLRKIVDKHNHYIDALRYALDPMIRKKKSKGFMTV